MENYLSFSGRRRVGVGGLSRRNGALVAKWGWCFACEPMSLCRQVVESIYGAELHGWFTDSRLVGGSRCPWKCVSKQWRRVEVFVSFNIGCDSKVSFWHFLWTSQSPLKDSFSKLFNFPSFQMGLFRIFGTQPQILGILC